MGRFPLHLSAIPKTTWLSANQSMTRLASRQMHSSTAPISQVRDYIEIIRSSNDDIESHVRNGTLPLSIFPNFLSQDEESYLIQETDKKLRRLCRDGYREAHFDSVIHGYKEALISAWQSETDDPKVFHIMERLKRTVEDSLSTKVSWTAPHVLDLRESNSGIKAHVDFVEASGDIIAGLCLISPAVMLFRHKDRPDTDVFKALLPERCLYIQRDMVRYTYTHEIPEQSDPEHSFRGEHVDRKRRISIMIRDKLKFKSGDHVKPHNYSFQSYG